MKLQFLILLLIPILLIPTVSGQIENELDQLKIKYQTLQEKEQKYIKIMHILWERVGERNFEIIQIEKKLTVIPDLNQYIRDLKVMVENRDAKILLLQTELNNTKIMPMIQKDEVIKQEQQIPDDLKEFSDPKILKQKIKLRNELISLKPELFKLGKALHDEQEKARFVKYSDEPIREFELNWYGALDLPVLGEYSIPISTYEEYIESVKHTIKETKKEHKEWKERQEQDKLELQKQQELDKLKKQLSDMTSNNIYGKEFTLDDRGDGHFGHDDYSLEWNPLKQHFSGNIIVDLPYGTLPHNSWIEDKFRKNTSIVIKNSQNKVVHTDEIKGEYTAWFHVNHEDHSLIPFGEYTVDIKYEQVDGKFSGTKSIPFYYFNINDESLTNAEKITHLQKQLEFVKNYFIKNN